MPKQCRLCGGIADYAGKNVFNEDVYKCSICQEPGHHLRFKEITAFTEREKLVNTLLIYAYVRQCKGIKTETLKQILELIEQDLKGNL